mmetsp:Transcript_107571/g.304209  ORF Transcript_107571/g.304209 Transcript_107571/m.304209 type:complete len:396 (-) Transcript_107571:445-1632(-)
MELGHNLQLALTQGLDAPVRQVLAVHPPLGLQEGLDDVLGPRADPQAHGMRLLADPQALLLQRLLDLLPGLKTVLAAEGATDRVDPPVVVKDADLCKAVPLATLEIVGIMRWCDLHAPRAKVALDHWVGHHHHLAVRKERVHEGLPDEGLVSVVLRMHSHGGVPQHRLQPGRCNHQGVARTLDHILELAQHAHLDLVVVPGDAQERLARNVFVVHLEVRECCLQVRAPVHETVVPVDEALVVETNKGLLHCPRKHLVHGEPLARPVHARGDPPELVDDAGAVLLFPLPDALQELFTAKVVARELFLLVEEPLHNALRRDAGMVRAGDVQGNVAAHPVPTREAVLDGARQSVAKVQGARDVGWRDHHHKPLGLHGVLGSGRVRCEKALLLPPRIPG